MRIGITTQKSNKNVASFKMDEFELPESVLNICMLNGITPVILPETNSEDLIQSMLDMVDGVIITGGGDVDTRLYGEKPLQYEKISCMPGKSPLRDQFETKLIRAAFRSKKPILGICRGLQIINVVFGGSLYQNLATQYEKYSDDAIAHFQVGKSEKATHEVEIAPNSKLYQAVNSNHVGVNSYHHQAIKRVGTGLKVSAKATDGLIEGIETADGSIQAVQWHPEQLASKDEKSMDIFKSFFKRCERNENKIKYANN